MTDQTSRLQTVLDLISARAEVERQLLTALVDLVRGQEGRQILPDPYEPRKALLTVNDFCERAQISRATVYRLMRNGSLNCYKIGKRTLFDEEHLNQLLRGQPTKEPKPENRQTRTRAGKIKAQS